MRRRVLHRSSDGQAMAAVEELSIHRMGVFKNGTFQMAKENSIDSPTTTWKDRPFLAVDFLTARQWPVRRCTRPTARNQLTRMA